MNCNHESQTSSGDAVRLGHIDQMKAIAILCMVEVHTAAILPPEGISVGHPAAFVAAAFGGMAAPLFVTVSGWGMHRGAKKRFTEGLSSRAWIDWVLPRVVLLTGCQILVNVLLAAERGGRFEWHTPGVLTLLAIAAILAPLISRMPIERLTLLFAFFAITPILIGDISGADLNWFERVDAFGTSEWIERLLVNGTYPVLPWLAFSTLGALLADSEQKPKFRRVVMLMGATVFLASTLMSFRSGTAWALTEGEALLTFFPASIFFIFVSAMFVFIAHEALLRNANSQRFDLSFIEATGRLTLTIYVLHFAILGLAANAMIGEPRLSVSAAFAVTFAHTLAWIPLANLHQRHCPNLSLEALLRRISS